MSKILDNNEFVNRVKKFSKGEYTLINKYKNSKSKIKIKHNKCNNTFEMYPNDFINLLKKNKIPCPVCTPGKANLTPKLYYEKIKKLTNGELLPIENYKGDKIEIKYIHTPCGTIFKRKPNNILDSIRNNKIQCPLCNKTHSLDISEFKMIFNKISKGEYTLLSKYINDSTKIKVRHNNCGYEYKVRPSFFIRKNSRCPKCANNIKKTLSEFKKEVYELVGDEYKIIGKKYINNKTPIKIKHMKCGYEYKVRPENFLLGNRCPKCKCISHGEKKN